MTSDLFPQERDEARGCKFNSTPESPTHFNAINPLEAPSDVVKFAVFMRLLAPSTPTPDNASIVSGRKLFRRYRLCSMPYPYTAYRKVFSRRYAGKEVNLFSDLALHNMGPNLADGISQGSAAGDEFRTAPLWGIGKRIFFLHDGRTKDLLAAIRAHASAGAGVIPPSEANQVLANFNALNEIDKQNLLNFLRSL